MKKDIPYSFVNLSHSTKKINGEITISGSKSESNRLLILSYLYKNLKINNLSTSDDTLSMINGLNSEDDLIDVGHAGTTMRFLTSFFSISKKSKKILTGSPRMLERPIKILVDALIELGAKIDYKKKQGYPPLIINGRNILGGSIELSSEISSQYISSLFMSKIASNNIEGVPNIFFCTYCLTCLSDHYMAHLFTTGPFDTRCKCTIMFYTPLLTLSISYKS